MLRSGLGPKSTPQSFRDVAWTLVDSSDENSTAVFGGGAFSLKPGIHAPPFLPPPPPPTGVRQQRTLYLSHSENLAMTGRTNGTVRASVDNGVTWPYTFQATTDNAPHAGTVFDRQAFGYSCLTNMPRHSQFVGGFLGLLWETSTPDCSAADASCAVKFSVVPQLCEAGGGEGACDAWQHRAPV